MNEAGETWRTNSTPGFPYVVDGRSEIAKLIDEVAALREAVYECHNQEESYHSLIANAVESVRFMVANRMIEEMPTDILKKELKRRKKLSRGSV